MKAVILAGGLGTRISEETLVKPKPMIEIGGMPILWHIMMTYYQYGLNDFIISFQEKYSLWVDNLRKVSSGYGDEIRLLIEKKEELERLFMSKNLDELKSITFNHKKEIDLPKIPITSSNGEHNEETGVVTQADKKGQPADSESQK